VSLPAIEYGSGDTVRKADQEGDVSFRGHRLRLGRPFHGEPSSSRNNHSTTGLDDSKHVSSMSPTRTQPAGG
jgi:hypothetical protein